ncbi:MAG TPA: hypothetical protein VLQ45_10770 [Thermoanaerobaculia bacterium]|nr:hypothetical protein [Thermoanaerobaculia bacterium]
MDEHEEAPLDPVEEEQPEREEDERSEEEEDDEELLDEEAEEGDGWPRASNVAGIHSKFLTAGSIDLAGTIVKQLNVTMASGLVEPVQLSVRHFRTWTREDLERCEAELVFEPEAVEDLRWSLEETRLLILSGKPESGKGSFALLVGSHFRKAFRLNGLLTRQGLDSTVRADLEEIASSSSFSRQVVIFEDVLAGENPDFKTFFKSVDPVLLASLAERLRKNESAIVLTVGAHTLADFQNRLESLGILKEIPSPSPDLLLQALHRFVDRLPLTGGQVDSVEAFLAENEGNLVRDLTTIPRMARFAHEYLREVAEGNLTLRQAIARMDDLSQWLTTDLQGDPEAQASVLAIVLGSAIPPAIGVPWFSFDQLRRRIADLLRKELRLPDNEPLSSAGLGRVASLERARAHVVSKPALTRFRDDRYPQWLWQALLGSARDFVTLLVPLLKELTLDSDPFLRASAASALGRFGQIESTYLAKPILDEWTRDESVPEDSLGFFLQGVLASEDRDYRDFCLEALRRLAVQEDPRVAQAAVCALRLLGRPDPGVPIRELCVIARSRLPIQIERLRLVEREIVAAEEEIQHGTNPRRVSRDLRDLHAKRQVLMTAALVPEERIRLLGAIRYSLAGVLFAQGGDPGVVLSELISWMKAEPAKLAPLFAYLFLHRKGLIDLLDRHKWISGPFGTEACSRFLLSASRGPEEAAVLREFLERLFRSLQIFPGLFRHVLEQRFLQILRNWSQEGCKVIGLRPTVIGLLSGLLASENPYLRKTVDRFLRTDPHFTARGSRLRALAVDVLNGGGLDPAPTVSPRPRRLPSWMAKREGETA